MDTSLLPARLDAIPPEIVGEDEDDVGWARGWLRGEEERERSKEQQEQNIFHGADGRARS